MFEISINEYNLLKNSLKSQIATSNKGGTKYMLFTFTERGVSMLSSILRSTAAIQVNIAIMRAFVAMRNHILQSTQVSAELLELRSRLQLVERDCRENLEAMNDLSEDVRKDIDAIYEAIGALSVKLPKIQNPARK